MNVWQARIVDDAGAFMADARRLIIYRHVGDATEMVIGFSDDGGNAIVKSSPPGVLPDFAGFLVPRDAIDSLVESIKPGPSSAEIRRLEEALALERGRVNDILRAALPASTQGDPQ